MLGRTWLRAVVTSGPAASFPSVGCAGSLLPWPRPGAPRGERPRSWARISWVIPPTHGLLAQDGSQSYPRAWEEGVRSAEASDLPAWRTLRGVRSPESGSPERVSRWRGHVTPLVAPGPPCNVGLQAQRSQDPSGPTFHSSSSVTTGCCYLPRPLWGPLSSLFGANS